MNLLVRTHSELFSPRLGSDQAKWVAGLMDETFQHPLHPTRLKRGRARLIWSGGLLFNADVGFLKPVVVDESGQGNLVKIPLSTTTIFNRSREEDRGDSTIMTEHSYGTLLTGVNTDVALMLQEGPLREC